MLAEIKDIYCAAFAIAKGAQLQDVTNRQGWTHFLFEATAVQQALAEWNQPQAQVDVHAYNNAMRYLRSIVRAQGTRVNGASTGPATSTASASSAASTSNSPDQAQE